jgi:hypothetical protein
MGQLLLRNHTTQGLCMIVVRYCMFEYLIIDC